MKRSILFLAAAVGLATAALAQPPAAAPPKPPAPAVAASAVPRDLPEGPGKAVIQMSCAQCHGMDVITNQSRSRQDWIDIVSRMIGNGAQLSDDEYGVVIDYLAKNYGPSGAGAFASGANGN